MSPKRWNEIACCRHEWSDYFDSGNCATPYCEWTEQRCLKCGIYSRSCRCGFEAGLSGEPRKREMNRERKKQFLRTMREAKV